MPLFAPQTAAIDDEIIGREAIKVRSPRQFVGNISNPQEFLRNINIHEDIKETGRTGTPRWINVSSEHRKLRTGQIPTRAGCGGYSGGVASGAVCDQGCESGGRRTGTPCNGFRASGLPGPSAVARRVATLSLAVAHNRTLGVFAVSDDRTINAMKSIRRRTRRHAGIPQTGNYSHNSLNVRLVATLCM